MNFVFKFQFISIIAIFLIPLNSVAQISYHTNEVTTCKWNGDKWTDCLDGEVKMVFYFNEGLSNVRLIDDDGEASNFPIKDIEPFDEETKRVTFTLKKRNGDELRLWVDTDDNYISIVDTSSDISSEWTFFTWDYETSINYGTYFSESMKMSEWNGRSDKYVDTDEVFGNGFMTEMDLNEITIKDLSNQNDESSDVSTGIKYVEYDSENNWAVFESDTDEDLSIYVVKDQSSNYISGLYIFFDLENGQYQRLGSMTNLRFMDDSDEISDNSARKKAPPVVEAPNSKMWTGAGSGIIFSTDGYIATNYHVIENANEIEVEFKNRGKIRKFNAEVIKSDPTNDLAIIKINDDSFEELAPLLYNLKTRTSDIGQSVFALGYPKSNIMGTDLKFTDGKISSRTGAMGDVTNYQTTTPIQSGNSGGPLFDTNGNLIAINSSKMVAEDIDNVSYSIKTIYLIPLIDALPENITLPNSRFLQGKDFTEQFKVLEKYVTLIRVK
tara:strand:+ start:331 stop:1818 length:1488 start_codon:yes stop_codon:yes gene_type:complete